MVFIYAGAKIKRYQLAKRAGIINGLSDFGSLSEVVLDQIDSLIASVNNSRLGETHQSIFEQLYLNIMIRFKVSIKMPGLLLGIAIN